MENARVNGWNVDCERNRWNRIDTTKWTIAVEQSKSEKEMNEKRTEIKCYRWEVEWTVDAGNSGLERNESGEE